MVSKTNADYVRFQSWGRTRSPKTFYQATGRELIKTEELGLPLAPSTQSHSTQKTKDTYTFISRTLGMVEPLRLKVLCGLQLHRPMVMESWTRSAPCLLKQLPTAPRLLLGQVGI